MDKEEIITHVANDILNTMNIGQIVNALREHSVQKALAYYEGLNEDEQKELTDKILAAKAQAEAAEAAPEVEEVETVETEMVS